MTDCPKCHGAGWYAYDENHSRPCEVCCKHDSGHWLLGEEYADKGKWACRLCGNILAERANKKPRRSGAELSG